MPIAESIVSIAMGYGVIGLAIAAAFLSVGIGRIDDSARGVYAFRPLLIPGIVLLWPLVAWRWYRLELRPVGCNGPNHARGDHQP